MSDHLNTTIGIWKDSLERLLRFYESKRGAFSYFFPKLFLFFVVINLLCYWWAMFTAFPELTYGAAGIHYFKVQFPVGFLGALFDSLSFFATIFIIRRALRSRKNWEYVAHLSLDLVIAILATLWVLFIFSFSGWLIHFLEARPQALSARNEKYEQMLYDALGSPTSNLRNIYFGIVMGVSASLPTCVHVSMFLRSSLRTIIQQKSKQ
jgi:hypothetical protein